MYNPVRQNPAVSFATGFALVLYGLLCLAGPLPQKDWVYTSGVVIKVYDPTTVDKPSFENSIIEYQFEATAKSSGRRIWTSRKIRNPSWFPPAGFVTYEALRKKYPKGTNVTVGFEPHDPSESVLESDKSPLGLSVTIVSLGLGLVLSFGFLSIKNNRQLLTEWSHIPVRAFWKWFSNRPGTIIFRALVLLAVGALVIGAIRFDLISIFLEWMLERLPDP